jgi:phosphoglycerate dehydrogenase-like enzyme
MKLVYHLQWEGAAIAGLRDKHADVAFFEAKSPQQAAIELADADILVVAGPYYAGDVVRAVNTSATKLRWVQSSSIGTDKFEQGGVPEHIAFTNAAGLKGRTVAEHAMAILLAHVHAVPQMERHRSAGHWARDELRKQVTSLEGKTLLVLGYGSIGREIARKALAFDMRVVGLNRSGGGATSGVVVAPIQALEEWLPTADFVVCTLPLTAETKHLIGGPELSQMKPSACIVNVGRGPVIEHTALVHALQNNEIAAACLDVFEHEPLSRGDPLWRLENALISPHVAGTGGPLAQRFAELVSENISRFRDGQALLNEVRLETLRFRTSRATSRC